MPRTITLGTLVTRCQQRADREGDSHISVGEWKALISEVYGSEIYGTVADAGLPFFQSEATITATGAASYNAPADHLSTIGVEYVDGTSRRALRELMAQEVPGMVGLTGDACYFEHRDDQLYLYPSPASGSYKWKYIAQSPDLSAAADNTDVDVINSDGESALLWGVTVLAKAKSEEDVSLAIRMRDEAKLRLMVWAANRSMNSPRRRIVDDGPGPGDEYDPADWRWRR